MHAVYRTTEHIPEFDARPGDYLVVDPAHPTAPVQVVRHIRDRGVLPLVLKYENSLELIRLHPPVSVEDPAQWLRRHVLSPA